MNPPFSISGLTLVLANSSFSSSEEDEEEDEEDMIISTSKSIAADLKSLLLPATFVGIVSEKYLETGFELAAAVAAT